MAKKKTLAPAASKQGKSKSPSRVGPLSAKTTGKRAYLSQTDVPALCLAQALRVPRAIAEHYAHKPTTPLNVAAALDISPTSGTFRQIAGAAIAYGLTKGGPNADEISIEPLGMSIVRPLAEGKDTTAKKTALLSPRVIRDFLGKYDKSALPREDIGRNVLIEMGVPSERAAEVLEMIIEGAESLGFLKNIKEKDTSILTPQFR